MISADPITYFFCYRSREKACDPFTFWVNAWRRFPFVRSGRATTFSRPRLTFSFPSSFRFLLGFLFKISEIPSSNWFRSLIHCFPHDHFADHVFLLETFWIISRMPLWSSKSSESVLIFHEFQFVYPEAIVSSKWPPLSFLWRHSSQLPAVALHERRCSLGLLHISPVSLYFTIFLWFSLTFTQFITFLYLLLSFLCFHLFFISSYGPLFCF